MDLQTLQGERRLCLGEVSLFSYEMFGLAAISCFCTDIWMCFAYGYCDQTVEGAGYLAPAIFVGSAALFVMCLIAYKGFGWIETLKHSQAFTLAAGILSAVSAFFIAPSCPIALGDNLLGLLNTVNRLCIAWGIYVGAHALSETRDIHKLNLLCSIPVLFVFALSELAFSFGDAWAYAMFVLLPLTGMIFLLLAAKASPLQRFHTDDAFWFVSYRTTRQRDPRGRRDLTALVEERFKEARHGLALLLTSIFLMTFYMAFVRYQGMQHSSGFDTHSVGAEGSLAILAIVVTVVLIKVLVTGRYKFMHWFYILGVIGMCFAALVMIFSSENNILFVRVIENVAYVLYVVAMGFAMLNWRAKLNLYTSNLLAAVGVVGALGTMLGWGLQASMVYLGASQNTILITTLGITLVVFSFSIFFLSGDKLAYLLGVEFLPDGSFDPTVVLPAFAKGNAVVPGEGVEFDEQPEVGEQFSAESPAVEPSAVHANSAPEPVAASKSSPAVEPSMGSDEDDGDEERLPPKRGISFREATQLAARKADLSRREAEILPMLLKGYSNQRIAEELVVSYHTVRSHVRHIYVKMDAHNREDLSDYINAIQLEGLGK